MKLADSETREVLDEKTPDVPGIKTHQIIPRNDGKPTLLSLEKNTKTNDYLGEHAHIELGARVIPLDQALSLAIKHNRRYIAQRDSVYLQALNLTLTRHRHSPLFGANADTRATRRTLNNLTRESTLSTQGGISVSALQRTGAQLSAALTGDFLQFVSGGVPRNTAGLTARLSQPLLRGAGFLATMETLTQAERNLLYTLREFVQYRQEFVVQISTNYYRVLQSRDSARNSWLGLQSFQMSLERQRALTEFGRSTLKELGRLEQAYLENELSWNSSVRNYIQALDDFKIELGIPVTEKIVLDENELTKLKIEDVNISALDALKVAFETRLDLITTKEKVEDSARKIKLASRNLLPSLDLVGDISIVSDPTNGVPSLNFDRPTFNGGLNLDLPIDLKDERNDLRASVISYEQAKRNLELSFDNIRLQVANNLRTLDQAKTQFKISQTSVELADRRLEEQNLLSELGRGDTRDIVDAERDQLFSRNNLTASIVNHTIARLNLYRNMGILYINDDGGWRQVLNNETID